MLRYTLRVLVCSSILSLAFGCPLMDRAIAAEPGATATAVVVDARLAQKVTYEARFRSVRQIMDDLSVMTGVKLTAGYSRSDWQVYSRKMNIFVKDVRLSDLLDSIARAMKFRWGRSGNLEPPAYRIVIDNKAVNEANARKARADFESEEAWRIRRERWAEALDRDGSKSDSEINAMRKTDPVFYRVAKIGAARGIRALFEEVPETKDRFLAGQSFRIGADKLSENTRELLFTAADECEKFMQRGRGQEPTGFGKAFQRDNVDIAFIRQDVDSFTPNMRWGVHSRATVGVFHVAGGYRGGTEIADLKDKDAQWIKAYCDREDYILDGVGTFRSHYPELEAIFPQMDAYLEKDKSLYPNEPLNEHSEFLELETTVKFKIETPKTEQNPVLVTNGYIASFQKALADATGMGVVSDSWANIEGDKLLDQEGKLRKILDEFAVKYNYNWGKSPSGIVEFRHRMWWKNRLNQIPDEWVAAWSGNTRRNLFLSLSDLAAISSLTYDQAEESIKADKVIGSSGLYKQILATLDNNCNLHWLRLYSMLSPRQRAMLEDEQGLNGLMLTEQQWRPAQRIFDRIGPSRGEAIFHLERAPNDKEIVYRFTEFDADSGKEDRQWEVTLPAYTPPPDETPKKQ